ncbi:MAG: beta-L-arabinofuranosidase domain-containing protein [Chloroflexota bacterium]
MTHTDVSTERAERVTSVLTTPGAIASLAPLDARGVTMGSGFWTDRRRLNRERTIPHGFEQLRRAGNLGNLRLAAGTDGRYHTLGRAIGLDFPFLDSDVYKWLEAAAWELGRAADPALAAAADEAIGLIEHAQRPDGYLNSFVQVVAPGREYQDLAWGHELYCVGHLIQAGVAWQRALGDSRLLDVAVRATDSVDRALGSNGREGVDGHPEIEMALVELYRATTDRRYLELAARMVGGRGRGILGAGRFGPAYWQDHEPVATAASVAGHAVRQLYLDCGAVDVATELGDERLLSAVVRRWREMIATRTYLTGGVGSHHLDEAFGDPYELPPDRAYAETCGAIASVMLAWRLLLATGDPACADVIERTIYNGVLPGVSFEGTAFFYDNPLQRRTVRAAAAPGHGERATWFPCACCPPNLMRTIASWDQYLATSDQGGIQVHQYANAEIAAETPAGSVRLSVETDYPWDGCVRVQMLQAPDSAWSLSLRVPAWSHASTITDGDAAPTPVPAGSYWASGPRAWQPGDAVVLDLDMTPRVTVPDPRVDAVRGCVALERGPLVYCIETADLPPGVVLEEVQVDRDVQPASIERTDLATHLVGLTMPAVQADFDGQDERPIEIGAIPYFAWANRAVEAMRVWIPVRPESSDPRQ